MHYRKDKTLAELELLENWQRKLWRLAEAKPIQYLRSQDLTTFWQIGNKPPKFSPAKVLCIRCDISSRYN